ncbi:MAG: hypothetical protein MRY64_16295 [Hyphomonadaceae bacterium]|nr:hypothetical protein [Hyphomonadaceae bacterium]
MKRSAAFLLAGLLLALPASAELVSAEVDTYRFGGTFVRHAAEDARACAALCEASDRCLAWSQVSPEESRGAACELKASLGRAEFRPGYLSGVSGVHQVAARPAPISESPAESSFANGYQPVSLGMKIDELLGASKASDTGALQAEPGDLAATTRAPARRVYSPRYVAGARLGTVETAAESGAEATQTGF